MPQSPLQRLNTLGQSIWLDYIRRDLLNSGELATLIAQDVVCGMTSNPAIFERGISGSSDYDAEIAALARAGADAQTIYEALTQHDVQRAADIFRPVYDATDGRDGYVSLEVDPRIAHDAQGTIVQARRLWQALDRPNVMIKVPATRAGLVAIRQLVGDGINVNVTLLFGLTRYREVARAYIDAVEARLHAGLPVARLQSVASFFVSRIDTLVDSRLAACGAASIPALQRTRDLTGQVAIASARLAYQIYREMFCGADFRVLAARGASTQRLLWASTSTKAAGSSDVKYVDALIGSDTVNTVPLETLHAYRDHGDPQPRLEHDVQASRAVLDALPALGIDIDAIAQQLEDEGVAKFITPFEALIATLDRRLGIG
jgi:transaldolase